MEKSVAALTPFVQAGAVEKNIESIIDCVNRAKAMGIKIAVLPLNVVLGDLGHVFFNAIEDVLNSALKRLSLSVEICCVFADDYDGFRPIILDNGQVHFADFFKTANNVRIRVLPAPAQVLDADVVALPCSCPAFINSAARILPMLTQLSSQSNALIAFASNGNGNSSYKFVRSAEKIIAHHGIILGYENSDLVDILCALNAPVPCPKMDKLSWIPSDVNEVFSITARGIFTRMRSAKADKLVLGLSGGLDSACALLFAVNAFNRYGLNKKNIIAVRMPSAESGKRTKQNGKSLSQLLGVYDKEIPINVENRLKRICHNKIDVVYENAQARERAAILLDLANKENALVLGTSDLTELALGFSTYGGDQLAHYNPNSGLTKLAVLSVVRFYANNCTDSSLRECLLDIANTPYSPELKPNQSSEDILGPYKVFEHFLLRLLAFREPKSDILLSALNEFGAEFSASQLEKYYDVFIRRFFFGRFKHNFSCDGIALMPFDLSFFNINCDINPQFLL